MSVNVRLLLVFWTISNHHFHSAFSALWHLTHMRLDSNLTTAFYKSFTYLLTYLPYKPILTSVMSPQSTNMATTKPEVVVHHVAAEVQEKFQRLSMFWWRPIQRRHSLGIAVYHYTGNTNMVAATPEVILPQITGHSCTLLRTDYGMASTYISGCETCRAVIPVTILHKWTVRRRKHRHSHYSSSSVWYTIRIYNYFRFWRLSISGISRQQTAMHWHQWSAWPRKYATTADISYIRHLQSEI